MNREKPSAPLPTKSRSTGRGVLLGLLLIPLNAFWIITIEAVQFGPYVTTLSLLPNVLFWLLLLNALNRLLHRFLPAHALTQGELLGAYVTLAVGSVMAGCDLLQILMHYIGHPTWAEEAQPGYADAWKQSVPAWLTISDQEAIKGYYRGSANLYTLHHLQVWVVPVAAWMLFIALLTTGMVCLNALVYRRWAEQERLPFPLVMLPMEMTAPEQRLWRSPLFWIAFAIACSIDLWNGFAFLYPSLPTIPTNYFDIAPLVTEKPWSAIGWTTISFYPMIIGIGFLLPLDLLLSCWFFYLFWKAQLILSNALAWDITPKFPYTDQQGFGGVLALGILTLYSGRRHLAAVVRRAFGYLSEADDSQEAIRYRTALLGFTLSFIGLVVFCVAAGLHLVWAVVFFVLYFLVVLTVARIRAEFGAPVHDLINAAPEVVLTDAFGPRAFSTSDLTVMSLFYWFSKLHRSDLMPQSIEAMKLGDQDRATRRGMLLAVLAAIHIGALSAFWAMIHQGYALGNAAQWGFPAYAGWETFNRLNSWLDSPKPPNLGMTIATAIGALCCMALVILRNIFVGFPFHPIAYVISGTFQMNLVWLPLFIAWCLKGILLRFGGRAAYIKFLPFFFGLILGQAVGGALWSLASVWTRSRMYSFWGY